MKIQISSKKLMPGGSFVIYKSRMDNKTYITPPWIEVPNGTTKSDIEIVYEQKLTAIPFRSTHKVKGSKGSMYDVIIDTINGNSCTCVGFSFHRTCKHIKSLTLNK